MPGFRVTKVKLDNRGMQQLLNEQFVRDHLTGRAERVRDQAQAGGPDFDYQIQQDTTDRVRVAVGSEDPGVLFYESSTGNLLRALDAAAGS